MSSEGGAAGSPSGRPSSFGFAVRAHPSAFVAPGAVVVGEVTLGARASVWFGAVLRGDMAPIEVGDDTNVQDNAVFHVDEGRPARVGRRVVVGHGAIVHGAEVEDGCLVGMGSILLTGCRVGAGSLVAAGAVVGERKVIPPRSLVAGVPGKIVGEVGDALLASIDRGVEHYLELARTYRERGLGAPLPPPGDGSVFAAMPPAPDELEVARLLGALAAAPAELAVLLAGLAGADASRLVAEWLHEDEEVWAPRLAKLLGAPPAPPAPEPPADPVSQLAHARARSLAQLRLAESVQWARPAAGDGGATLADLVRRWVSADAMRLRALAAAGRRS